MTIKELKEELAPYGDHHTCCGGGYCGCRRQLLSDELLKAFDARLAKAERLAKAVDDFTFRVIHTYGGPSPYLKAEELEAALADFRKEG